MIKKLSILSLTLGLLVSAFAFTACGSDDNDNNNDTSSNPLVGTWRAEVKTKDGNENWDLTFTNDYKFASKSSYRDSGEVIEVETGTYTVVNDIVTISGWGSSAFKINGNELTFSEWDHGKIYKKIK